MNSKFLAVADCHFKFINGVNKKWQRARYKKFIDDIVAKCVEEGFILIIAGDTFESINPKRDELKTFLYFLHSLEKNKITTLLVSGNHETISAGSSILDYLELDRFSNLYYRKNYVANDTTYHLVNHDSIHSYKPTLNKHNVLISHFRCTVNKFITEEINVAEFTSPYDLCIVGDIHSPFDFDNVWYCNNPINKEFEAEPNCGYLEVNRKLSGWDVQRVPTDYPALVFKKCNAKEYDALDVKDTENFYKIEVAGSPQELRLVQPIANSILHKIPLVPASLKVEEGDSEIVGSTGGEEGLISYMKSIKYSDQLVSDMLTELGREL
jgi:DNA repair exonuclease SbcCD nuclease subunit